MAPENLSGIPPQVTLSGLDAGPGGGGFSGATQQGLGGAGGFGGLPFGGTGGPDLLQLLQALSGAGGDDVGAGTDASLTAGLGAGAFGQGVGGLGAGSFGQTQPGYVAGQSSAPGFSGEAQQAAQGSADPFAIIQKFLGIAGKLAGAAGQAGTSSPTQQGGGGGEDLSLTGPLFQGEDVGQVPTASPTLADDLQGALGSPYLSDPTLGPLFTTGLLTGSLSPADLAQIGTLPPDQLQGLRTALFEGGVQSDLGSQLLGGQGAGGFTLGTGNATPTASPTASPTNLAGALQGGIGGALGLTNLLQAIQSGNITQGVGGGLQGIGGLASLLQSAPQLAQVLGISPGVLGAAGAGAGGLGGLLGLATGIQSLVEGQGGPGTALQLGGGALGVYNALQSLGLLGSGAGAGLGGLLATYAPGLASGLASTLGGVGAGATGGAAAASAGLAGAAGGAAPIIAALISYFGAQEEKAARESGWANNPIAGALYERATQGQQSILDLLRQQEAAGGRGAVSTQDLMAQLAGMSNALYPSYTVAQGPKRPVTPYDTMLGMFGRPGIGGLEQYNQNLEQARTGVFNTIQELANRGVTLEQLGALPGPANKPLGWGETYLAGMPALQAINELRGFVTPSTPTGGWNSGAGTTTGFIPTGAAAYDPGLAAQAMGGFLSPQAVGAGYGGAIPSMLATLDPGRYAALGGQFNVADPAVQAEIERQQEYANMINQQALQEFTSGGG